MKIIIHENTLVIKTIEEKIIDTIKDITYVISPDAGKLLRNKKTGFTTDSSIGVGSKDDINNYEEIDKR